MLNEIFSGIIQSTDQVTLSTFLICTAAALLLGLAHAFAYMYKSDYSKSFIVTLALLPAIVSVIIMMVNGSVGAGVAVAGAFSLIRFRSAAGTAKEIGGVFLAMAIGLACGMGYPAFAALFTVILCAVETVYTKLRLGEKKNADLRRQLTVTMPEDLNYTTVFDDLFVTYTSEHKLLKVKTTNLGSLNRLTYEIVIRDASMEKDMIDDIRVRNGNLEITCARILDSREEL